MCSLCVVFPTFSDMLLRARNVLGPRIAAVLLNSNILPWLAPTYFVPNKSLSYAAMCHVSLIILVTCNLEVRNKY